MKLFSIITETWRIDGGVAFGVLPKSIWVKQYESDDNNLIPVVNRLLVVDTGERRMLIDTGYGNKRDEKYYYFKYITERTPLKEALQAIGYTPDDITDVVFTHLHDDHVGGAVEKDGEHYRLVFPGARHWVSRRQYEWATHPNPREAASFFPENIHPLEEAGVLHFVEEPGEIIPGIDTLLLDGHTGGQIIPVIHTEKTTVVYTADFIPSKTHIHLPYIASVDIQPLAALEEKRSFLATALEEQYLLVFEHDYYTEACRVMMSEKGITAGASWALSEIFA